MFHLKRTICPLLVLATLASAGAAQAATYYVAKTGADGTTCTQAQNPNTPKLTIPAGVSCLSSGDTLMVRAGTYPGQTIQNVPAGSAGAYTVVRGYPGERPRITLATAFDRGVYFGGGSGNHHVEIRGFEFDGVFNILKMDDGATWVHHINFIDNIAHDTVHVGILIFSGPNGVDGGDHLFQGNTFYNVGVGTPGYVPGMNVIYGTGNRTIIEKNTFHNNPCAIAIYMSATPTRLLNNVIVRNNLIYQNARNDLDTWQIGSNRGPAIGALVLGGGHQIYNNIIYDSMSGAIDVRYGATTTKVYNNTIYNMLDNSYAIAVQPTAGAGNEIRNNIAYLTGGLLGGTQSNNLTTNPSFVNAAAGNFQLQSTSVAIDAGMTLAIVPVDFAGVPRPLGAIYDVGAYEHGASGDSTPPAPPLGLSVK